MSDGVTLQGLRDLPPPQIIESLDYEVILAERRAFVESAFAAAGFDYTVGALETDPVMIVVQGEAYRETLVRARINDGGRANLVRYSTGADLDHLAGWYDVTRLVDETDERLRERLALAIAGRSPGGTEERYKAIAMGVSLQVDEVAIYQVDGGPQIELAVLAIDNGGTPDQALLDAVEAKVTAKDVLLVNDTIIVVSAIKTTVDVTAQIWLLPGASDAIITESEARLRAAWAVSGQIGFDLNPSWISAVLFVDGVSRVVLTAPAAPVIAKPNEAIALETVTIQMMGRSR